MPILFAPKVCWLDRFGLEFMSSGPTLWCEVEQPPGAILKCDEFLAESGHRR